MPYIEDEVDDSRRQALINEPFLAQVENCGELNFIITELAIAYLQHKGRRYQTYNDIEGAFSLALKELYRRSAAPYEDQKIEDNGDVYPAELLSGPEPKKVRPCAQCGGEPCHRLPR